MPFNHDWLNLTDEGIGGVRYADDKWKNTIPRTSLFPMLLRPKLRYMN